MVDDKAKELTLYIQSKKAVTSFYRPPQTPTSVSPDSIVGASPYGVAPGSTEASAPVAEETYFLSDDQARCLALAEELGARRGYKINVVDIGKAGRVERLVAEHLRNVQNLPVLVNSTGQRLEGVEAFTEDNLCSFMPTELRGIRAFTYVKVRGGDLDRIRDIVLTFPEVRELHLLTGDWDVFIVLEFPDSGAKKREVLDFVTERIRGIPEVLDTSTLVPEYSATKFPT
jgi:DNA-binding Lrp family transcriptional regulator